MLRAPIAVLATVPFVFGLPIWPWMIHSRAYHLEMDVIYNRYKDEIINPWVRSLKEEGEKSLIGTIELSSKVAKELVASALTREDKRYNRECNISSPFMETSLQGGIGGIVCSHQALSESCTWRPHAGIATSDHHLWEPCGGRGGIGFPPPPPHHPGIVCSHHSILRWPE
jgi:hypothetical protein